MSYTLVLEWMPGDLYMSAVTARCTAPTSSYSVVWLPPNKVYQITLYCGSTSLVSFLVGAFRGKAWSYMKKKALKAALAFFICWVFFVALEGLLLIGSTDPGKAPLIVLGGAHIADEIDAYSSLGFSQTYYLTYPDSFVSGEFKVFGVKVAGWER